MNLGWQARSLSPENLAEPGDIQITDWKTMQPVLMKFLKLAMMMDEAITEGLLHWMTPEMTPCRNSATSARSCVSSCSTCTSAQVRSWSLIVAVECMKLRPLCALKPSPLGALGLALDGLEGASSSSRPSYAGRCETICKTRLLLEEDEWTNGHKTSTALNVIRKNTWGGLGYTMNLHICSQHLLN